MDKFILRMALIISASIIFVSCDKSDDTVDPSTDLEQTCWTGTVSKDGETHGVTLFFETSTHGSYEADDYTSEFRYEQDRRIIEITGYPLPILVNGKWWIDQRTTNSVRMVAYPMTEDNANNVIALQRIYQ